METPPAIPAAGQRPSSSLIGRLFNVFAGPGDVFEELRTGKPVVANWLAPLLLACLTGVIYSFVVFSQDNILHSIREAQEQQLQKQVAAGKMTRQQADQALEMMQRFGGPTIMKIFGSIGAVVVNVVMLFLGALVIWLLGRWCFKSQFSYMQSLEATGLAGMINVLGGIVMMLLAVMMGSMAMTPGPVLLVHEFDPANKVHRLLGQLNLITIWYIGVLALGLSKLGRVSYGNAAVWLFGIWATLVALFTLIRLGG
jgi:hypothetical protein